MLYRTRHGSREEKGLPFCWQLGDHFTNIMDKTHIEHTIGLIQYKELDMPDAYMALLHQVEQTARCCDQHFWSFA